MTTLDIRGTVVGEVALAVKAPCLVATTGSNITLSGAQTIDGVSVGNASERVLVKDQTTASQNGIYIASSGAWVLAADFTNNNNVAFGTLVLVTSGNVNAGILFEQTCTDSPVVIGTSLVAFSALSNNTAQAATSTTSLTVGTGAKTLTVQSGKAFAANQYVVIYETSAPATNSMLATVTSYSGTSLVVNVVATTGSGTHTDWSVVLTNSQAGAGIQPPVGSGNVTGPGSSTVGHIATFADGTGKVLSDGGAPIGAAGTITGNMLTQSCLGFGAAMINGYLSPSLTDGNTSLTMTVLTLAGATPSASDPVWFVFNETGSSAPVVIEVTAALSLKVPAASTLGTSNSTAFRFWFLAVNNGGTVALAVINCLSGTNIYPLGQAATINTTAFGGATSAQVAYTSAAVGSLSGVAYSVLGYVTYDAGLATAGTYASLPSKTRLYIPSMTPLPGAEIQALFNESGAVNTGTTVYTGGDTAPTSSQGNSFLTQAITPTSAANVLEIEMQLHGQPSAGGVIIVALQQDSVSACLSSLFVDAASNTTAWGRILHRLLAATTSSTTFKAFGGTTSGTFTLNGSGASRELGGTMNSFIKVREIMA